MKLKQISYSSLANTGNYENEKIELTAELDEGEDWETALADLTRMVHEKLNNIDDYHERQNRFYKAKQELRDIEIKVDKAKKTWETVSAFLIAQGIKSDPASFPDVPLLPQAPVEQAEIVNDGIF